MSTTVTMSAWLKKKGSRFGFWQKRYCKIVGKELHVGKSEKREPKRVIAITPETGIEVKDKEKPPRFTVTPVGGTPICLAHDSLDTINRWAGALRDLTVLSTELNMECFDIVSTLGRGFYGKVMLVRKKDTDEYFAIKTVHKSRLVKSNKVHTIFSERNVLVRARHPFIVRFGFAFQTDSKVYLGLEYASGGELFRRLQQSGTVPLADVRLYVAELSLAMNYLHFLGVVYRDLKPENVLLDALGHVKLTDFGLAKEIEGGGETGTFCGTSEYLAPEIIARKPYGAKIDWWAIGVLTYELLYGRTPFYNGNKAKMFQSIRNDKPKFPRRADNSTVEFISMLLEKDPAKRADFGRVKGHPFFADLDFETVLRGEVKPLYCPPANGDIVGNFDTEFTMENPQDSLATPIAAAKDQFEGFSYAGTARRSSSGGAEADDDMDVVASGLKPSAM